MEDTFIGNLSVKKLGKSLLGKHEDLPDAPGIYFAIDSAHRVWYVGISTTSLRQRHSGHEKLENFKTNKVQHIAYYVWNDTEDLQSWEIEAIHKFDPPLNMDHTNQDLPQTDLGYGEEHFIDRYREIKQQIKMLERELEQLGPNLVTLLEANGGAISDKQLGYTGYIGKRQSWQYSPETSAMDEQLKNIQEKERKAGIATVSSVSTYPVFRFR